MMVFTVFLTELAESDQCGGSQSLRVRLRLPQVGRASEALVDIFR